MTPSRSQPPNAPGTWWLRVLLLGFMGAGKSTIGPLLARALGWEFLDVDAELVRRSGVSVPGWFERFGEARFREEEARLTTELCARERLVLAPGGGWAAHPGGLDTLPPGTGLVWLRVSAEEAVRRCSAEPGARPLLAGPDPLEHARRILAEREACYARAHYAIDVDGRTPAALTTEIIGWLKISSW